MYGVSNQNFKDILEMERIAFKPGRESVIGRALLERATGCILLDAQTDPEYRLTKLQKLGRLSHLDWRTLVAPRGPR